MLDWYDLNARHEALFLWGALVLAVFSCKDSGVRNSLIRVVKNLIKTEIVTTLTGLALITIGTTILLVYLGNKVGLWMTWPIVTALVWSITSGIPILMDIGKALRGSISFTHRMKTILSFPIIVAIFINLSILPWWWELILAPVMFLLTKASVMGWTKAEWNPAAKTAGTLILMYNIALISLAIKDTIVDDGGWKILAQSFIFPIFMTLTTATYLAFLVAIEKRRFIFMSSRKPINRRDYGPDWPLTVDSAVLCKKYNAIWIEANNKKYALNGRAHAVLPRFGHSFSDLREIWADDPNLPGLKISVHQLIQDGLALDDSPIDPTHS